MCTEMSNEYKVNEFIEELFELFEKASNLLSLSNFDNEITPAVLMSMFERSRSITKNMRDITKKHKAFFIDMLNKDPLVSSKDLFEEYVTRAKKVSTLIFDILDATQDQLEYACKKGVSDSEAKKFVEDFVKTNLDFDTDGDENETEDYKNEEK